MVCALALGGSAVAVAATDKGGAPVTPAKWVEQLADDSFGAREKATRELLGTGEKALPYLEAAARDKDPERAMRARLLIRKIDLGITPDTSPEILSLVSQYEHSKGQDKVRILDQLRKLSAWKPVIKLYSLETDQSIVGSLRVVADGVWVLAARPEIVAGRLDAARALLELAPADAQGMIALAEFRDVFGVPDSQSAGRFERSGGLWRMTRHRVAGRYAEAAQDASQAGDSELAASLRMLDGDPMPWLRQAPMRMGAAPAHRIYAQLAARRWSGGTVSPKDLASIHSGMTDKGDVMAALALLGCGEEVDAAMRESGEDGKWAAFRYFESLERVPEALQAIGIDPAKPDFGRWLDQALKTIRDHSGEQGDEQQEMADMVSFLERRGFQDVVLRHFDPGFKEMAANDPELFLGMVRDLIIGAPQGIPVPAPVLRCASAFAGDDDAKWESIIASAVKRPDSDLEFEAARTWWHWLGELEPRSPRPARLESLMAMLRLSSDPDNLRARLLEKAWKAVDSAKEGDKPELLRRLADLALVSNDAVTGVRAIRPLWKSSDDDTTNAYLMFLSATGDWKQCAEIWQSLVAKYPTQPDMHAHAAAALRRAGREAEAAEQGRLATCLALGDGDVGLLIANAYAIGGDFGRATMWWKKVLAETKPELRFTTPWTTALANYADFTLLEGKWKEAASAGEAVAMLRCGTIAIKRLPTLAYRCRLNADLPRAMLLLRTDKPKAIAILRSCQQLLASDGSLADRFFPALREAGLRAEHDAWFEDSWSRLAASINAYPACDNTRNTAAWLAARAGRRLDEAEAQERVALKANPSNGAYMDTMAEIFFSRGDRAKAREWSDRSLLFDPIDIQIRAQNARIHSAPLPGK
jgi:tetratricopeptide (TPR) repeat protein